MLTPHEIAALMLIGEATPNANELDRATVETLIERQLVQLEGLDSEQWQPSITTQGSVMLHAIAGIRRGRATSSIRS